MAGRTPRVERRELGKRLRERFWQGPVSGFPMVGFWVAVLVVGIPVVGMGIRA